MAKNAASQTNLDFQEEKSYSKSAVKFEEKAIENPGLKNEEFTYGTPLHLEVENEEGV